MHTIYTATVDTDDDCEMFLSGHKVNSPYTLYFETLVSEDIVRALECFSFNGGCADYMNQLVKDAISDLKAGVLWFCYGGNQTVRVCPYDYPDKEDFYHAV